MKIFSFLLLLCSSVLYGQDSIRPTPNLLVEGVPAIAPELAQNVQPYLNYRSASFCDWHPEQKKMIISTRFGNTPQLHLVDMAMGARKQLTFFNEPVTNAVFEPGKGEFFFLLKTRAAMSLRRFSVTT